MGAYKINIGLIRTIEPVFPTFEGGHDGHILGCEGIHAWLVHVGYLAFVHENSHLRFAHCEFGTHFYLILIAGKFPDNGFVARINPLNNVDKFITPSKFFIEKFVEWGWDRERFTYIPNFVDTRQFQPRGDVGKAFVYLGRLLFDKGVGTFIRAVAKAGAKGWIVGTGPEEQQLRDLAIELNADVEFLGYKTGEDMADTIRNARVMVLPSELYENAPICVLEAYALERPVIGADIGGIPELIHVGETGALFPSRNVDALAEQMRYFTDLPDAKILEMGKTGREWAEKKPHTGAGR